MLRKETLHSVALNHLFIENEFFSIELYVYKCFKYYYDWEKESFKGHKHTLVHILTAWWKTLDRSSALQCTSINIFILYAWCLTLFLLWGNFSIEQNKNVSLILTYSMFVCDVKICMPHSAKIMSVSLREKTASFLSIHSSIQTWSVLNAHQRVKWAEWEEEEVNGQKKVINKIKNRLLSKKFFVMALIMACRWRGQTFFFLLVESKE